MPIVQVSFVEGPSPEDLRELLSELTDVVVERLGVPRQSVAVVLYPVPAESWASGGVPVSDLRRGGA